MACKDPCPNCSREGLPILFARYAAAYSVQDKGMAVLRTITPKGLFQAQPDGVVAETALYNVRMLRPGYLYLRIERVTGEKTWEAYAVHPHGYLNPFPVEDPQAAAAKVACARDARQGNNSLVWVEDAKSVKKLWYMFSPDTLDYQHLKSEIKKNPGKYMQSLDVAGWLGGSQSQPDTCPPGQLDAQVVEYKALKDEALRDAMEPQLYGLMGASLIERGWGDYEEEVEVDIRDQYGEVVDQKTMKRIRKQPAYDEAHGPRLQDMRKFLADNKGAVAACHDPMGIAQELGHLQVEAQVWYTHWQLSGTQGFSGKVSNEWAFQSAMAGQELAGLFKKKAIATAEMNFKSTALTFDERFDSIYEGSHLLTEEEKIRHRARLRAQEDEDNRKEWERANEIGNAKFNEKFARYFDEDAAKAITTRQKDTYEVLQQRLEKLGQDQVAWLKSGALVTALGRYSRQDDRIGREGGGACLSLQLAHCLAGTENNRAGLAYLEGLEPEAQDDNLLARVVNFSNATLAQTYKAIEAEAAKLPVYDPQAEPSVALANKTRDLLKQFKAGVSLADKAQSFIDTVQPAVGQSSQLRQQVWVGTVSTLLGVKMLQKVKGLPASGVETWLVRRVALTGLATLGSNAASHAKEVAQTKAQQYRLEKAAKKMGSVATKSAPGAAHTAVGGVRVVAMGAVLNLGIAAMKGVQVSVNATARGASELAGNLLQGIAGIADFRAKAFEKTIYDTIRAENIYKAKVWKQALSEVNRMQLRAMRMTAFKFALPAALVSIWWDVMDALKSNKRGDIALRNAQFAAAAGTLFTLGAAYAAIKSLGMGAAAFWAPAALWLGLIGAVIAVGVIVAIWILKEAEWVNWLKDNPLNKERKGKSPIHDDLMETLQKLANVKAESGLQTN